MEKYFKVLNDKFKDDKTTVSTHGVVSYKDELDSMYLLTERLNQDIENKDISFKNEKAKLVSDYKNKLLHISKLYADTKTPIAEVFTILNLLRDSNLSPEQARSLQILRVSVDSVAQKIQEGEDYARVEGGAFSQKFTRFNLHGILLETYDYFHLKAIRKGIDLKFVMPENFWRFYKSDAFRVTQVINSLLSNAIDFSEDGEIEFRVEQSNRFGTMVELKFIIKDNGNGVELDRFGKLFQQVKMKYSSNISNENHELKKSGFDTITKIARYIGGDLKVGSSGYQNGVQFTFTLPLEIASE